MSPLLRHRLAVLFATCGLGCTSCTSSRSDQNVDVPRVLPKLAAAEHVDHAFWVSNRPNVKFGHGFGHIAFDPPDDPTGNAFRYQGLRAGIVLHDVIDATSGRLKVIGWVNSKVLNTKPTVSCYLDGTLIASRTGVEAEYSFDESIDGTLLGSSSDHYLEITLSSIGYWDESPPRLRVALVSYVNWEVRGK